MLLLFVHRFGSGGWRVVGRTLRRSATLPAAGAQKRVIGWRDADDGCDAA
jgi:hypothetical protein